MIESILQRFDDLDMKILSELTKDASISIPQLSKKLNINSSVLYSRIKRLMKRELIRKFTVIINESQLGINIKATVGINRDPKLKEPIHNELIKIRRNKVTHRSYGPFRHNIIGKYTNFGGATQGSNRENRENRRYSGYRDLCGDATNR